VIYKVLSLFIALVGVFLIATMLRMYVKDVCMVSDFNLFFFTRSLMILVCIYFQYFVI